MKIFDGIQEKGCGRVRDLRAALGVSEATIPQDFERVVTLPAASARCQRLKNCQAATTAVRDVSIAAAEACGAVGLR
jgi:hypothetical protein